MKNVRSQRQFKAGSVPSERVNEFDRVNKIEPNSPSATKRRSGVNLGSQTQARPGLAGMQDYSRKPKSKGRK